MNFMKINTANKSDFEFVQKIYIESFPPDERRPLLEFQRLIDEEKSFTVYVLTNNDERIGILTFWNLDSFIYAEHFAISPEFRSEGYGKEAMNAFLDEISLPLILEVELPTDDLSIRRVKFYERVGFCIWDIPYSQPPYEEKYNPIPMKLMTYGKIDLNADFEQVKSAIYQKVYGIQVV